MPEEIKDHALIGQDYDGEVRHMLRERMHEKMADTQRELSLTKGALRDLRFILTHFDKPGDRDMLCSSRGLHFLKHAERELRKEAPKGLSSKERGPLLLAIVEHEAGERVKALESHLKKEAALIKKLDNIKED